MQSNKEKLLEVAAEIEAEDGRTAALDALERAHTSLLHDTHRRRGQYEIEVEA